MHWLELGTGLYLTIRRSERVENWKYLTNSNNDYHDCIENVLKEQFWQEQRWPKQKWKHYEQCWITVLAILWLFTCLPKTAFQSNPVQSNPIQSAFNKCFSVRYLVNKGGQVQNCRYYYFFWILHSGYFGDYFKKN